MLKKLLKTFRKRNILKHSIILAVLAFFTKFTLKDTLSFADILPFAGDTSKQITQISYYWSERFLGYNSFTSIVNIISAFFELISFGKIFISQFLFWGFFYTISYYSFVAVLKELKINPKIAYLTGFIWVFNPDTLPDSTFELIIYSLLPITFLIIYKNLQNPKIYRVALLAILAGIQLFNSQMFFWTYIWIAILTLVMLVKKLTNWKKIIFTALAIIPALALNPFAVSDIIGYTTVTGSNNIDYQKGFDDCYHTINTNLFRLSGNSCSYPAHKLRIFENTFINSVGYIFPAIIGFYLWKEHWLKKTWKKKDQILPFVYFSIITIGIIVSTILVVRLDLLDYFIAQKNVLILSIRNQTKFTPILTFSIVILLSIALNWFLLEFIKKQKIIKNISTKTLQIFVSIFLIFSWTVYNRAWLINPNTNTLKTENKQIYNKQKELKTFLETTSNNEYSVYLPSNRPISLTNRWNNNIVSNTVGNVMKDSMEYDIQYDIYKKVCKKNIQGFSDYDINIKYVIIDKTAQVDKITTEEKISSENGKCTVAQFYGAPLISADQEFFTETFKQFPVVFENDNFTVYKLNSQNGYDTISLDGGKSGELEFDKKSPVEYEIELSQISQTAEIIFRQSFDDKWKIYITNDDRSEMTKLKTKQTIYSKVLNKFEIDLKDIKKLNNQYYKKGENGKYSFKLKLFYEPQKHYQRNVIISAVTLAILLCTAIYFKTKNR